MGKSQTGAVAAGHNLTAKAGAEMLREGGSAVDAAIAALAMACVCEPVLASPGGGGFAMIRDGNTGKTQLLDFFTQTPLEKRGNAEDGFQTIETDFGPTKQIFHIGPATVATPGFLDGLDALSKRGARLTLQDHFAPAIEAASSGFKLTGYQAYLSTVVAPILMATEASRNLFAPVGQLRGAGETFVNPGLAETFRVLGQTSWRDSEIAGALLEEQAANGHLSEADLSAYRVEEREPLSLSVGEARVFLNPGPAASGTLIQYALQHLGDSKPVSLAAALNAADEARLSARGDLSALLKHPLRQNGTTHISAVDADGNACSVTVSNGTGSGEIVNGFGFMLNNIPGRGGCKSRWFRWLAGEYPPSLNDVPYSAGDVGWAIDCAGLGRLQPHQVGSFPGRGAAEFWWRTPARGCPNATSSCRERSPGCRSWIGTASSGRPDQRVFRSPHLGGAEHVLRRRACGSKNW
jgi:gamma-glutamyltranspeptidase/glutathione hydrolase